MKCINKLYQYKRILKTLYFNYNKSTPISNEISSVRIEISIDYKEMLILKQLILEIFSIEYIYSKTVEI